jgi:hypothetical protein
VIALLAGSGVQLSVECLLSGIIEEQQLADFCLMKRLAVTFD